jgi:hypothetical protein
VGAWTTVNTVVGDHVTVWIAGVTVTDTPVLVAAALSTSASIVAVTVHVPAAVAVNTAPDTVHVPAGEAAKVLAPVPVLPEVDSNTFESAAIVNADGTTVMLCAAKPIVTAALAEEVEPLPIKFVARTVTV